MVSKGNDFHILVIDDNTEIHDDFIKILTSTVSNLDTMTNELFGLTGSTSVLPQFHIDTATQGQEGVRYIEQAIKNKNPYALAFVDIRMPPGWDGVETIKHIWALDPDIQIVICTAYSDYSWEETISELGQSDNLLILKKPFDCIAVRQLACALTQKWKLMQESRSYTKSLEHSIQMRTKELEHQALHDSLTGLPNRVFLQDKIEQAITTSHNNKTSFAVLFFDLDRFKLINDSLGHEAGDALLREISLRLQAELRENDTLARLGGDEFVLVATELAPTEERNSATVIANLILNTIKKPITIHDRNIIVTASIGICLFPRDATKIDDLLKNADTAMYRAKEFGADQFRFYSAEMNKECLENLNLETELHHAIKHNEFCLYYQPSYDATTCTINVVEALLRWNHPTKGLMLPIDFIAHAEKIGILPHIGEWVLRESCQQAKTWLDQGLETRISVNITSQQLRQFNFVEIVKNILDDIKLPPHLLELELSESIIINNTNIINIINSLKNLGLQISINDFGIGYSNLDHLKKIKFDRLKLNRSLIENIALNKSDEVIVHAVIAMARSLHLEILAEGIQNQTQLDFLKKQNCDSLQGLYCLQPLSSIDVKHLLQDPSLIKKGKGNTITIGEKK